MFDLFFIIDILLHLCRFLKIKNQIQFSSVQSLSRVQLLCDPMNCSTPGLPVHHQFLKFTQTHVHRVGDAIQLSHPLSPPSPPAPNPSQHKGLFWQVNSSHQVAKVLEFQLQHQSFQWTPRTDLLYDGLVGSPCSPRDSPESYPTPQFKSINFLVLSFLHSPTLISYMTTGKIIALTRRILLAVYHKEQEIIFCFITKKKGTILEIQPINPKGNHPWIFIGNTDAEAEIPILWPPDVKNWSWERPWHWERLKAGEGVNRGWNGWRASPTAWTWVWTSSGSWWWTGKLVRCSPWGHKELDMTDRTELNRCFWNIYTY